MIAKRTLWLVAAALAVGVLAACGSTSTGTSVGPLQHSVAPAADTGAPVKDLPLRPGEHRVTVRMPTPYKPSAPTGVGTDDYRCFLLDPHITHDSFVTGFNIRPGSPQVVHHVILFRVPPDRVAEARAKDASDPGEGWTCFGTSGIGGGQGIDDAPWLGAWAPGGTEQLYGNGLGESMPAGSMIVMQVHYNLLLGDVPDQSAAELRLTEDPHTQALQTVLLPAPVELPCRPDHGGPLCDRAKAFANLVARFGPDAQTANFLHLLCGGTAPGPVQSCTRTVQQAETVRGVAGHMHLLGQSISIVANQGTARQKVLLDIKQWNFDNQRSVAIAPFRLNPGDTVTVSCRHSQRLRDLLPAFASQRQDRYVMWGDGSTDEMCLGILLVTRP
jgi:hypothetical protein